jgi:transcriptional regulator with XRE-family HTH domain
MNAENQVRRWSWRLKDLLRERGRTQRSIEQQLGWASGYLSHLLRPGPPALKVEHVLQILEAIEVAPHEFFAELYGFSPGEVVGSALGSGSWTPGAVRARIAPPEPRRDDELERINEFVQRAVRDAEQRLRLAPDELRGLVTRMVREELDSLGSDASEQPKKRPKAG